MAFDREILVCGGPQRYSRTLIRVPA
jgi:hypothetical protein